MVLPSPRHDKLVHRLAYILTQLIKGETLFINKLAIEFNVSHRTLLRDFNERLIYLDLEHHQGGYRLINTHSALRTDSDILQIANTIQMTKLFPTIDRRLLSVLFNNPDSTSPYIIYLGKNPGSFISLSDAFTLITQAILERKYISYNSDGLTCHYLAPYKLIYHGNYWYACGVTNGLIQVIELVLIKNIKITKRYFKINNGIFNVIIDDDFINALPHFKYIEGVLKKNHFKDKNN